MLVQRRRRWANIKPALAQRLEYAEVFNCLRAPIHVLVIPHRDAGLITRKSDLKGPA